METPSIVAWRWKYLRQIEKYRSEGFVVLYLDEKWFYFPDSASMVWSNNTEKCTLSVPSLKVTWIIVYQAGSTKGSAPILSSFVKKYFKNHILTIMTTRLIWKHFTEKLTVRQKGFDSDGKR